MLIRRLAGAGTEIEFFAIEPVELDLLRQVRAVCEGSDGLRCEERLFTKPVDLGEDQFLKDWDEYVRPELRHLFLSARKTVKEDLKTLSGGQGKLAHLVVPHAHSDAWLNALNQARLILASKFNFTVRELSLHERPRWFSRRDMILQQINFYAEIQERIIDIVQSE